MCQKLNVVLIIAVIVLLKGSTLNCTNDLSSVELIKYKISLVTNVHEGDLNFEANVKIQIKALKNIETLELFSVNLTLSHIAVLNETESGVIMDNLDFYTKDLPINKEKIFIDFPSKLLADTIYVLDIQYTGLFDDQVVGYYEFWESKEYFAAISFQTRKARYFCPSFDEINMRAVFEIEVKHHHTYHVISNTNVVNFSDASASEFKTTKFLPTERITIASIAIIVSKFKSISTAKVQKVEIYGNDSYINACYLKDAMDSAFDGINLFNTYFKSVHNLTSLKLVTVPHIAAEISTYELIIFNQYHLIYQPARMTTTQMDKMLRSITRTFAVSKTIILYKTSHTVLLLYTHKREQIMCNFHGDRNFIFIIYSIFVLRIPWVLHFMITTGTHTNYKSC